MDLEQRKFYWGLKSKWDREDFKGYLISKYHLISCIFLEQVHLYILGSMFHFEKICCLNLLSQIFAHSTAF